MLLKMTAPRPLVILTQQVGMGLVVVFLAIAWGESPNQRSMRNSVLNYL